MLNAYEAVIENGNLKWLDTPPNLENRKVQVIILSTTENQDNGRYDLSKDGEKRLGFMREEKMIVPDDINKYDNEILEIFGID